MTLQIAIIGAGIGGLAAAIALRQRGFDVRLYEQATELREFGAGLNVTPNGARVVTAFGLRDELDRISASAKQQVICDYETREVIFTRPGTRAMEERYGMPQYQVHRGDLLRILLGAVPSDVIALDKRCVGLAQTGDRVGLSFHDGSEAECDILIGADGIRSAVREMAIEPTAPRFFNKVSFRALVPVASLPPGYFEPDVSFWVAPNGHIVTYLVSGGDNINVVAGVPIDEWKDTSWSVPSSPREFLAAFPGLNDYVRRIIEAAPAVFKWGVFDLPPLRRWSVGRVTLLGDAAHAMLPMHGQGANMAMEDGYALAAWLDRGRGDPVAALAGYEAARRPRTGRQQAFAPAENRALEETLAYLRSREKGGKAPAPSDVGWLYDYDVTRQWCEMAVPS